MKLITSTILLGIGALLPSHVQAIIPGPISQRNTYDSENGNICVSETTLDCTYLEGGMEKTCLSAKDDNDKPIPWAYFPAEECGQLMTITITMQMCNKNTAADKDILLYDMNINDDEAQFLFKKIPYQFDRSQRILPGRCITIVKTEQIEKCKVYPMQVKMLGNMPDKRPNDERAYCESFVFNKMKSKKIEQPILLPPQAFETSVEQCREVSNLANGGTNVCDSKVSIQCTFLDEVSGQNKSCIGPGRDFTFFSVREDLCGKQIQATIDMSICNTNPPNSGLTISPYIDSFSTRYTFKKVNYNVPGRTDDLAPGQCRSYRRIETIDTCLKNWPMSVQLEGNMRNAPGVDMAENSYCYCFLYKKAVVEKITGPPTPPTPPPQPTPPTPPPSPTCDETKVLITEIVDPESQPGARYIEVFFQDCVGVTQPKYVTKDIVITRTPNNTSPAVKNLKGELIPPNGIIVLCVNKSFHTYFFGYESCDIEHPVADNDGTHPVEIRGGPNSGIPNVVIDVWIPIGYPPKNFQDGRALRIRPRTPSPRSIYEPSQWYIIPDPSVDPITTGEIADPEGMDPGEWTNPLIITEIVDPKQTEPARYITINQPFPENGPIQDNLVLVIFNEITGEPDVYNGIPLKTKNLDAAKNLKVCNLQYYQSSNDPTCIVANGLLPGTTGCYTIGIISLLPNNKYSIVDLYGVRRQSCVDSPFDFTDGSATRKPLGKVPLSIWNPLQWDVQRGPDPPGVKLFITEIADPIDGPDSNFVEIFVPGKPNYVITDDLLLVRYENSNESEQPPSSYPFISLKGFRTDQNGFIVLCVNSATYPGKCAAGLGQNSIANNPGDVDVAITKGSIPSRDNEIVDIYGVPGQQAFLYNTFIDGRVNRKTDALNPTFEFNNWDIFSGTTRIADTDPGCWNGIGDCTPPPPDTKVIITEIADPSDGPQNRFVELFLPGKANYRITDDLLLVRYVGYNANPLPTPFLNLKGLVTDQNGFIVLCVSRATYGNKCTEELSYGSIADTPGDYDVAITTGTSPSADNTIIDIYGDPNRPPFGTESFVNGRVNRRTDTVNPTFVPSNWEVFSPKTSADTDPGCWNGIGNCTGPLPDLKLIITEIADPSDGPQNRFVELYSPDKKNYVITTDILLVRYESDNDDPSTYPFVNLKGYRTDQNGFIVLCVNGSVYGSKCQYPLGFNTIADNPGDVDVAIVTGGTIPSTTDTIIDIYGVPGQPTYSYQSFVKGRVNRKSETENPTFDFANWEIMPGGNPNNEVPSTGTDPGCWNGIGDCEPDIDLDLIITEIADPSDGPQNRFVELFSPTLKNYQITNDLLLVRYENDNNNPNEIPFLNLKGLVTDEYGFIVLCVNGSVYGSKCRYPLGYGTIADNPGDVDVAIVTGTSPSSTNRIHDIYGVPGQPTYSYQSFVNGRVNRRTDTVNPTFDFANWEIKPGGNPNNEVSSSGTDPGCWNGIGDCSGTVGPSLKLIITEIADPSDGPQNRFVELFSPDKQNYYIPDDLLLVRYESDNEDPSTFPFYNLKGLTTDEYGFITFCVNGSTYGDKCRYVLGYGSIADNPGDVDVAIVKGTSPSTTNEIVDIYGVPGFPTYNYQSFVNGRVNRVTDTVNPTFDFANWEIKPGGNPNNEVPSSGADPRCWNGIGDCDSPPDILELIITEIADPYDGQQNRFVEIYFPNKRNYKITEPLQLVRYEGSSSVPATYPSYPLTGLTVNEYGFIVFCVNKAAFGDKCDYQLGNGSIADNPGNVNVAVVQGTNPANPGPIVDIYGIPGQFPQQIQLFTGGRAIRIRGPASPTWMINDWYIYGAPNNQVGFEDTDPGCWKPFFGEQVGDCTGPVPPNSPPTPPPYASPSKGKGKGKGKDKNRVRKVRRLRRP